MTGFDIIGDVHGCATKLEALLGDLGYARNDWTGAYWHPRRRAVFVGDLIDRGDEQLRVLEIVKPMVEPKEKPVPTSRPVAGAEQSVL